MNKLYAFSFQIVSLFAICLLPFGLAANTYMVTTTADAGAGSFRQAITDANANAGADNIVFNISGSGPFSIVLASALPNLTGPVIIDGTTQPGFTSGTQSTYVKVGNAYTSVVFSATGITGITIKGLDISFSSPRNGFGGFFVNCNQTFILDNYIQNRNIGIVMNGGQDHTIQNNNFIGSGQDVNQPAVNLTSITPGSIPAGVAMSGNKFGGNANQSLRIQSMSNLLIGDENVAGANIVLEDNCGLTATGLNAQVVIYIVNCNNITCDNLNLDWLGGGQSNSFGIIIDNQVTNSTITVKNCSLRNRYGSVNCNNGKDYIIQNNDMRGTGENANYALLLNNITAANIPSGVLVSGNLYGQNPTGGINTNGAIRIVNMNNLLIGDASVAGANIKIEDNSGLNKVLGNSAGDRGAMYLQNVSNITIDNVDASWSLGGIANSFGIRINNSGSNGNITIKNCAVQNRWMGIYCSDGKDYTVTGNDLRGSGHEDNAALSLISIGAGSLPGGVLVNTNLYGRNPVGPNDPNSIGLYIAAMSNLTIGDATTGVEIKIEDNSGINTFGGNSADRRGLLYLDDVSNVTVDNLDLSYTLGGVPNSFGIYVENETGRYSGSSTPHRNVTIKNCDVRNRSMGIRVRGGKDYTIFNNNLRGSGNNGYYSMELANIQPGTLSGGVQVYSNLFGTNGAQASNAGLYVNAMKDLVIGDAATGVQIKLEDNSGLNQVLGGDVNSQGVLYLNTVSNITVNSVDCSYAPGGQASNSFGIRFANTAVNNNISIINNLAGNRARGIWIDNGRDYTLTGNNMVGSGNGNPALELSNITPGSLTGGILASGNTFGTPNFKRGVVISNMRDLLIGDASVSGANIVLEDNSGLNLCQGDGYNSNHGVLSLSSVDNVVIDNVDCSKSTAGQGGSYAIVVGNGSNNQNVTIKNCKADNRQRGIYCSGGKDFTVQNNTITNSGSDGEACALDFRSVTAGTLTGGILVSGNTFGNVPLTANLSRAAVRFDNMRDLYIGDASTGGNVKLEDGNGMTEVGIEQNSQYVVLNMNNVLNSTIDNLNLSYTGTNPVGNAIRIANSNSQGNITIKDCTINKRRLGIYVGGGKDYTITGNNLTGTGFNSSSDINNGGPAVWLNGLVKGTLDGGIAMSGNTFGGANANTALRIDDMRDFTIGDASVSGADIVFEDGTSGLATVGNNPNNAESVLSLNQISNVTISDIDLTRTGATQFGTGITIANGNGQKNNSIVNCQLGNRRSGLVITGGADYTITGNTLTATGLSVTEPALYLNSILEGTLTGGVNISGNTFGGTNANNALRIDNMKNLTIGDASVAGRNITLEDGTSGLSTTGNVPNSADAVIYCVNVANSTIDNVDLTRAGTTQLGVGIKVDNNAGYNPFTIKNCSIGFRRIGIYLNNGKNYTLQNNNLTNTGNNASEPALYLNNIATPGTTSITGTTFGGTGFNTGIRLEASSDFIFSDGSVSGSHITLASGNGIGAATNHAIDLANTTRTRIENIDLSYTGATATGTGLFNASGSALSVKGVTINKRVDGIDLQGGSNHTIQCSSFSNNTDAVQILSGTTGSIVTQCSFAGNTAFAINAGATTNGENNFFGGAAPPVGTPNGVTASVDATPFLSSAPVNCPSPSFPYLDLKGNLNVVLNGSTTPSTLNYTDFGTSKTGVGTTRTFNITNTGGAALNITSISFSGTNAADFAAGAVTPAGAIAAGGSATFTVTFTPGATGLRTASMDIISDDPNSPFSTAIQGTGKNAIVVTNTNDTGAGSLRQAITDANVSADADIIEFAIGTGAQTIINTSQLPTITQPLTIDGTSQPGFAGTPLITVNSNNSFTTFVASNVTGLTIKYINLSRPLVNYDGFGISLTNCNETFILNNIINNRLYGIFANGGRDHTIQNNDLRLTGLDINNPAIYLSGISARLLAGGVKISGNLYGDATGNNRSRSGIRINSMSNLIIGDASVANANIVIEDGSGLGAAGTGDNYVLHLNNVSNITVDNLDLTATTYGYQGWGIRVDNSSADGNVTIKNCKINTRYSAIYCGSGRNYTIQNNDLQKCGNDINRAALWFNSVLPGTTSSGVLASGNLFGDAGGLCRTALRIDGMKGVLIGNQTVAGADITLEDNSGIKASGSGGDNYAIYLLNVSDITIDKVDISSTIGYTGWGFRIENGTNNSNVTIKNCKANVRYAGIFCSGGKDYTILNNDLRNTSNDNSRPALYLTGIRPGAIPGGVTASGNLFGFVSSTAKTALRIDNMDRLLIGDASVFGANIVIEDNSGMNAMNNDGDNAALYMSSVSNVTVDNVDASRTFSGRSGVGIWIENSVNTYFRNNSVINCKLQQHDMALYVSGGKDMTITSNDFRYSGYYQDRPALYLSNIQSGSMPGGISMSANLFGGSNNGATSNSGIQINTMRDLVMADAPGAGVNIVLEDNCGLNTVFGDEQSIRGVMYLNAVRNVQMNSIDLSKSSAGQGTSFALKVNNSVNFSVINGKGSNRYWGYSFTGGRDITVTGNDLTTSGGEVSYPALYFNSILPGTINTVNGVVASGNLFGGNNTRTGLRIDNMKNILIGNETVTGAHIVLESTSGMNNIGLNINDGNSNQPAIYLGAVNDVTVDKVDVSEPTTTQDQGGITIGNGVTNGNVTISNCTINKRRRAIYVSGGRDYTIQNNALLNSGSTTDQPAIYLQNIQSGSLTGGVLMSGNTFGGTSSFSGIRFENMRDLTIGDASTGGNVKIEDNSGFNNMAGNGNSSGYYVLSLANIINATIDNVDISRPTSATPVQDFTGIRVDNGAAHGPITIKNCDLRRHRTGIYISSGKDFTITGNDLRGSGAGNSGTEPALYLDNITQLDGTVPMGIVANNNLFGTANSILCQNAITMANMEGVRFSDGSVANTNIALEASSGIKEVTGGSVAVLNFSSCSGITVEKVDMEFTGTQTGTGIRFSNGNASQYNFTIKDNVIKNRRLGLYALNGADYTITGNNFQLSGASDDEPAVRLEHIAEGTLYGGVSMNNNTFGGTGAAFALKFVNMSNLKISDGTFTGTNINLGTSPANGLYNVTNGYVLHLSGICNATVSTLDLSRAGLVRQGTGLRMNNCLGNTIEKVLVGNRDKGIEVLNGSNTQSFSCNTVFDNNFGFDIAGTLLGTNTFTNNIIDCNGTGLRNATTAVIATNNFWGTANGPTTAGGSGDSYSGTVAATPFLVAGPGCAQTPPDLEVRGNTLEIVDGDITPSFNDHTQYCAVTGQTQVRTYTLKNTGKGIMNLTGTPPVSLSPASGTPFTITSQPSDVELLPGETTTFTVQFAPVAFGSSNATLNVGSRDCRENPYNFSIKGQGCPDIQATLNGTQAICIGKTANLTINITAGTGPFVVLLSDGSTFTVNNIGNNTISVVPSATTTYTINTVTDANGCCSTNNGSATVTVNPLPTPAITVTDMSGNTSNDGILCSGATAVLDAGAYSGWSWNTLAATQTITTGVAGTYTVTVTDANGCSNTDTQVIVVNPNPTPAITVSETSGNTSNDGILCTGSTATLDAGAYSAWSWSTMAATQTITTSTTGTYTVTVTDGNGCTATDDQAIQVNPLPAASLSGSILVCPGTPSVMINLNVTAGVAPYTVVLSDGSSHNVAATGMSQLTVTTAGMGPLTFTITSITDANGCVNNGTGSATVTFGSLGEIEIFGNGVDIFDGDVSPSLTDDTDFGTTTGTAIQKTFTITNSDPVNSLSISGLTVTGSAQFSVMTPPASSVPANGSATFTIKYTPSTPGVANAAINVNSGDCDEQPYDFAVTAFFDCTPATFTTCPMNIAVNTDPGLCYSAVTYSAVASGTPAPAYTYAFTGATVGSGSGTGSGTNFNTGVTNAVVTATNPCGVPNCSFTITVTDNQAPQVTCPSATAVINTDAGAACSIVIPDYVASLSATDNCSTVTEAQSIPAGAYSTGVFDGATITVNYTATDGATPANTTTCTVTITVNDDDAPVVTCPSATGTVNTNAGVSCSVNIPDYVAMLSPVDNCSSVTEAQSIPVGLYTSGVSHGAVINISYTATDGASPANTAVCNIALTVVDDDAPTVSCPSSVNVTPAPGFCTAIVNSINATFSDNCSVASFGYALTGTTSGSAAGQASGLTFNSGLTTVTYTVTDAAGLSSTCSFDVTVATCVQISGNIKWENNNAPVKSVAMELAALPGLGVITNTPTDVNGNYTLNAGPGGDFRITPTKNINILNGVSSADATRIQQHIVNNPPLVGPYKRIAADVNRSNSITTNDATLITQALAGVPSALAIFNVSWRFVPTSYVFPNQNAPWGFPEKIDLTGVTTSQTGKNFVGVKIGDVNGTANPLLKPGSPVVWVVNDKTLKAGEEVEVTFRAGKFNDIAAYQFGLDFDPSVLSFVNAKSEGSLDLTADNFGAYQAKEGEFRAVWSTALGRNLTDGTAVFTLRFTALQSGDKLSEVLHLNDAILHCAAYNTALEEGGIELLFKETEVSSTSNPSDEKALQLFQNVPNPFIGHTTISFMLPEACDAQLRISDVNGRVITTINKSYPAGLQQERFDLSGRTGVLYYELTTPFGSRVRKMVMADE